MKWKKLLLVGGIVLFLLGCNLMSQSAPAPAPEVPPTLPPPPPPPTDEPVLPPDPTPEAPPVEVEVVHVSSPALGHGKPQVIHDQPSTNVAPEKRAYGGDEYPLGRYERPFTTEVMEYLPFIDITQTVLFINDGDEWIYTGILLAESPSLGGERTLIYGIELDTDLDGRGDVLVVAELPPGEEWTTEGVTVYKDVNETVGAVQPMEPDAPVAGDGYEVLIFDAGKGEDADLAWVRRSPDEKKMVEIAFKLDLVDVGAEKMGFAWGAWAFVEEVHPDWFDHHDHFSLEEAGSSLIDNAAYPLKAFHSADNTCRALSGVSLVGDVPGLCVTYSSPGVSGGCPAQDCPSFNFGSTTLHTCWNPDTCECEPCRE